MITKTDPDEFRDYLKDASNMPGGHAERLLVPSDEDELRAILREAGETGVPVTISGARTGTVGGAIPFGGILVSLEKLLKLEIDKDASSAVVGAGVILGDFRREAEALGLFYPPDPTEWSCQIGGNIATDASGARSFKYGSTRDFVESIRVVLADGDLLVLSRGEVTAEDGRFALRTESGREIEVPAPTYPTPDVSKDCSGYFSAPAMDAVDLFVGSEGTLGVITEAGLRLLPKPEGSITGIVFFRNRADLLGFVDEVRRLSMGESHSGNRIDASFVEYFDSNSLRFIREKYPETPKRMAGAVYFEQETGADSEDQVYGLWNDLLESSNASIDESWFAVGDADLEKMREFRHALPVAVNEKIVKFGQKKVSTDMAIPVENFESFLRFSETLLENSGIEHVVFGHMGDCHLHANMIPADDEQAVSAKHIYGRMIAQSIMLGGTVSAEHGIGKLKSRYLYVMYGERYIHEMVAIKKALDPKSILGRGNVFEEKFLNA
ncbi:MAG: FAD-binding oxidoreductase [Pyrinomonadaceae bacterium]